MKKKKILIGSIPVVLMLVAISFASVTAISVEQTSTIVESELQNDDLDFCLSSFGMNTGDTMGEFEQLLLGLVSENSELSPSKVVELQNDLCTLSDILDQIGVTDDMTIAEALLVIKSNPEPLQGGGFNLFCSMDVTGVGSTTPRTRIFKALLGCWMLDLACEFNCAEIDSFFVGRQYCEYNCCSGWVLGLAGGIWTSVHQVGEYLYAMVTVEGFALLSLSDVPFVSGDGGSNSQSSGQQSAEQTVTSPYTQQPLEQTLTTPYNQQPAE